MGKGEGTEAEASGRSESGARRSSAGEKRFIEAAEVWPEGSVAFSWRACRAVITGHQAPVHRDESIRAGAIYSVRLQLTIFPGEYSFSVAIGDNVPDDPHCGLLHDTTSTSARCWCIGRKIVFHSSACSDSTCNSERTIVWDR
jgi:hypothetical protein